LEGEDAEAEWTCKQVVHPGVKFEKLGSIGNHARDFERGASLWIVVLLSTALSSIIVRDALFGLRSSLSGNLTFMVLSSSEPLRGPAHLENDSAGQLCSNRLSHGKE